MKMKINEFNMTRRKINLGNEKNEKQDIRKTKKKMKKKGNNEKMFK